MVSRATNTYRKMTADVTSDAMLPTDKGLSFLEAKYHLLLNYCANIGFYVLLKAEGKPVKDHPVVDQLVRLRTLLEKLEPVEKKLKGHVDRLVAGAGRAAVPIPERLAGRAEERGGEAE